MQHRKTKFREKIEHDDKKILDVSGLLTPTVLNTKMSEFEGKILNVGGLFKKTDYDPKI